MVTFLNFFIKWESPCYKDLSVYEGLILVGLHSLHIQRHRRCTEFVQLQYM